MNIGIVVDNELNYDIRVCKEIEILRKHGYNIHVLCFAINGKSYPSVEGINITRIKIRKRIKNILFFFFNRFPLYEIMWKYKIKNFIKKRAIDIVHTHDLYMSRATYLGVKLSNRNCKIIVDLHENYPAAIQSYNWTKGRIRNYLSKPKAWIKKESEYLKYASKIIVLSEYFKDELLNKHNFLSEEDIISFPNVIDIRRFEKFKINPSVKKSQKVTLLYFGTVAERRGIFDAINAARNIIREGSDLELLIIGPVDKADTKRFFDTINDSKLRQYVRHIPWIDISELITYMYTSDICLAPFKKNLQHESGVANKIFQYMFGKKPIIASDCRPQKELIESFNCGLIYYNQTELEKQIKLLVKNSKLRRQLGENGYQHLYENYDNNKFNNILINIYKQEENLLTGNKMKYNNKQ